MGLRLSGYANMMQNHTLICVHLIHILPFLAYQKSLKSHYRMWFHHYPRKCILGIYCVKIKLAPRVSFKFSSYLKAMPSDIL